MKTRALLLFFFLFSLTSCSDYLANLYSPNSVNTPMLGKKGDIKAVSGIERRLDTLSIWQNHFAYAPTDKLGLIGSFSLARRKNNDLIKLYQWRFELGLGTYSRKTYRNGRNHFIFELYGVGGYGNSRDWNYGRKRIYPGSNDYARDWLFDQFDGKYTTAFIQWSTGFSFNDEEGKFTLEIVPTSRITYANFHKISHVSDVRPISLENPEIVTWEIAPAIKYGHPNFRVMAQIAWILPMGQTSQDAYERFSSANNFLIDMYLFAGLEYAFGKKEKKRQKRR